MKNRYLRHAMLVVVLGLVLYLALGNGARSFEAFCPFGGVESLWGLVTQGEFTCALGPLNLSMLIAVLALTLVAKKAFCGWACPIGFLGELAARLGGRVWRRRPKVPTRIDNRLRLARYGVVAVVLFVTYRSGELILRGYDPFYLLFSGFGHGSAGAISWVVLALIAVGAVVVPLLFCRYLCPLGAVLDPAGRLGLIHVRRDAARCTGCGRCGRACLHAIPVHEVAVVRHRDCTNCLECVDACPEKGALGLHLGR
jgi:polyferredoxin